jgi:hypothetical protein
LTTFGAKNILICLLLLGVVWIVISFNKKRVRDYATRKDEMFIQNRICQNVPIKFVYAEVLKPGFVGGGYASYGGIVENLSTETLRKCGWIYEGETSYTIPMSSKFERLFSSARSNHYLRSFRNDVALLYIAPLSSTKYCFFYTSDWNNILK